MSDFFDKIIHGLCCALTSCRRVFLLLLLLVVIAFAWVWWTLPDLDQLRPEIEAGLRSGWALKSLSLGHLSWRWRGDLEIHASRLSFISADGRIRLQDAQISLVVSISQLIQGIWLPEQIYIRHGLLHIHTFDQKPAHKAPSSMLLFNKKTLVLVTYEEMTLVLQDHQHRRVLHHAKGFFSTTQRNVELLSDELSLQLMLAENGQPQTIKVDLDDLRWLLKSNRLELSPNISAQAMLRRSDADKWQFSLSLKADSAMLSIPSAPFVLPFQQLNLESEITTPTILDPLLWHSIHFSKLFWLDGKNSVQATAVWKKGVLSLYATSPQLAMPLIWSWLRPINDDRAWQNWLLTMDDGVAKNTRADITLAWPKPWHALPPSLAKNAFHYHVLSKIHNADIHLIEEGEELQHTEASINLNEDGLHANIQQTTLPYKIGLARGIVKIPWNTLVLNIKAETKNINISRLHRWVDPNGAKEIRWKSGQAKGSVTLLWDPAEAAPESAMATLSPVSPWLLRLQDQNITVNAGTVVWQKDKGIVGKSLIIQTDLLHGQVNFDGKVQGKSWRLRQFSGDFEMPLARLVSAYHIPIAKPSGQFRARLAFDGDWRGSIILDNAAWDNFLGELKHIGQTMHLGFTAHALDQSGVQVNNVVCRDAGFQLRGRGHVNAQGMSIELEQIKTRGFRGRLSIVAPRGNTPWRMTVDADYLRRSALPRSIPNTKKEKVDKNWQLKASIRQFDWQDARMQNIQLIMRSERNSLGRFTAQNIDVGAMQWHDVKMRFKMLGHGKIEVERLHATMNKQALQLTATLSPLPDGSMRWQGFATTKGDFSRMMASKDRSSTLFSGGKEQLLFAGEGILMRKQPWWQGLRGRLRLRVDEGSIAKGGVLTKILAITSLADLPALLIGQRKDLTHSGLFYKRLQIEATLKNQKLHIHQLAMRSTAMDMAGYGHYNLDKETVDLTMVFRPLQNLDAMLDKIPLLRDFIGGAAHSFIRKVYHMYGSIGDATVEQVDPASAGLASPGIIEGLLTLPDRWFGGMKEKKQMGDN